MWMNRSKLRLGDKQSDGPFLTMAFVCLAVLIAMLRPVASQLTDPRDQIATRSYAIYSAQVERVALDVGDTWSQNVLFERPNQSWQRITAEYEAELTCLAEAIYYEARGESRNGQLAVAQVVMNRVYERQYPQAICGVVYQRALDGSNKGCQFSFTCDGSLDRPRHADRVWLKSQENARHAMLGFGGNLTRDATHYHADYVAPRWASRLVRTVQIGSHIFYKRAG